MKPSTGCNPPGAPRAPGGLSRALWIFLGLAACGLGFAGIILPGLPATVFFIAAAACFARSSPRLLEWVLRLPKVGPLVRDYRAGLGMPRSAKVAATTVMLVAGTLSVTLLSHTGLRILIVLLLAVGAFVIWRSIPTAPPRSPSPPAP